LYSENKLKLKENGGCGGCPPAPKKTIKQLYFFGKTNLFGGREGLRRGLRARREVSSFRQV
jgi:hypothetical protein